MCHSGQDLLAGHIAHGLCLDAHRFAVVFQHDLVPGAQLRLGVDLLGRQHLDVLCLQQLRDRVRRGTQVEQAPLLCGLPDPCVVVAISVEDDPLVCRDGALDQLVQGGVEVLRLLQLVRIELQRLGYRGVEHDVGTGDGVGGAQHPKFKFVAGKGKGGGAVAVCGVPDKAGEHINTQLHLFLFRADIGGIRLDGIQHGGQLIAQEYGDHGGRRLVGP